MVRWRKGHTFRHHGTYATFSRRHDLFKNERSSAVTCTWQLEASREKKSRKCWEMTGHLEIHWWQWHFKWMDFSVTCSEFDFQTWENTHLWPFSALDSEPLKQDSGCGINFEVGLSFPPHFNPNEWCLHCNRTQSFTVPQDPVWPTFKLLAKGTCSSSPWKFQAYSKSCFSNYNSIEAVCRN